MARGKHVKSHELIIPRGSVKPMTGIVTDEPIVTMVDKTTSAVSQLRREMDGKLRAIEFDIDQQRQMNKDNLYKHQDRMDKMQRQINHCETALLIIAIYLVVWLVGWGFGAW